MQNVNLTRRAVSLFPSFLTADEINAFPVELRLIAAYAAQNPGLEFGCYCSGYNDKQGRSAYFAESRKITKQLQDVRAAITDAWGVGVTSDDLQTAAKQAFSGRLSFITVNGATSIDYTTGQYWSVEYRAACAAVIKQATAYAIRRVLP